jgi:hypothetical protein
MSARTPRGSLAGRIIVEASALPDFVQHDPALQVAGDRIVEVVP